MIKKPGLIFVSLFCMLGSSVKATRTLVHPGIVTTEARIELMRNEIAHRQYPAYDDFCMLRSSPLVGDRYTIKGPYSYISRDDPTYKYTNTGMSSDFSAAQLNALMYVLTRQSEYARKSVEILKGYAHTLVGIPESNDRPLLVGLEGFKIAYATELLKYTYPDFDSETEAEVDTMLKRYFLPPMEVFYATPAYTNGNWGFIVDKGYMAIGILLNDTEMYHKAVDRYINADDNGTIKNYIDSITGQLQESGRDQGHSMLAIGNIGVFCEMAYQQGDDLFSLFNNRYLRACEYVARYNLGYDVPFRKWTDITGKYSNWSVISSASRGLIRPVFEVGYNHYVHRKKLSMPYTEEWLNRHRPEGFYNGEAVDYGSLLFMDTDSVAENPGWNALNADFTRDSTTMDDWETITTNASLAWENGHLVVQMAKQTADAYRADIRKKTRVILDGRNEPVLAVKIHGVPSSTIAVDTNLGPYGNGFGEWTGQLGDSIFYCILPNHTFGDSYVFSDSTVLELSSFGLKVYVSGSSITSYQVDWIKVFPSLSDLKAVADGISVPTEGERLHCYFQGSRLMVNSSEPIEYLALYDLQGRLIQQISSGFEHLGLDIGRNHIFILRYIMNGVTHISKLFKS